MTADRLPQFVIAGAPKAGTTALHAALATHPGLYLSPVKEPKYYLTDGRPPAAQRAARPGRRAQRAGVGVAARRTTSRCSPARRPATVARGEHAVLPLRPGAQARLAADVPGVKVVVVVRDPVDRAWSNWVHLRADGLEPEADFLAAVRLEERRIADGWAPFWHYRGLGRYGEQLRDLLRATAPGPGASCCATAQLVDTPAGDARPGQHLPRRADRGGAHRRPGEREAATSPTPRGTGAGPGRPGRRGARGARAPPQVWRQASAAR